MADDGTASPRRRARRGDAAGAPESSRADQRSRLLDAIVGIVAERGYPDARIGDVAAHAGVSRATFYQLFENKEACFLAAQCELNPRVSVGCAAAIAQGDPARAIDATLGALIDFAGREPAAFSFLTHESMLAGPGPQQERERLLSELGDEIEQAHARSPRTAALPEIPAGILLGGVIRVLGIRMRSGPYDQAELLVELVEWVESYRVPRRTGRKSTLLPMAELSYDSEHVTPAAMAPAPLPRGRHRLPPALVRRIQRERILYATAEALRARGYENTTVADIVATAGVSREVFYSHFHSRSDAYLATHKLVFEQMMATAAGAFFASSGGWPDRVWDGWVAATGFVVGTPSLAHFAFLESYALGPPIAKRTDDAILAFTVFLRDGQQFDAGAVQPSASTFTAIAGTVMETTAFYLRHDRAAELFALMPLMTYMILAPFLGIDAARELIERKLREDQAER